MTASPTAPANATPAGTERPAVLADARTYASGLSRGSLMSVVLVHAALLATLLYAVPDSAPVTAPRPITVSLLQPEIETKPQPEPEPPPPKPQLKPPPSVLVAKRTVPPPQPVIDAPEPEPEPEPIPELLPPPTPVPVVADIPKSAPPPPPTPPRPADYLSNPKPAYPALSRRLNEQGVVRLNILVNTDGSVARLEIAKSSGYPRLDEVAKKTVQSSWKFEPARQAGKPIQDWVIVPIQFTLRS